MKRATSPEFFLACCNHPRIRPYIGGDGQSVVEMDPARWERSYVLEWPDGCIAFERISPGVYSAHWAFLPGATQVVAKGKQALRWLFGRGAERVVGKTPLRFRHAIRAARAAGMKPLFDDHDFSHTALSRHEFTRG